MSVFTCPMEWLLREGSRGGQYHQLSGQLRARALVQDPVASVLC